MLTDLLDISRIDSGNVKLRLEEVDLAQVVDTVVETTQFHFDATGTELRLHLPEEPAIAEVDVTRVERIIRNLVVNALEHGEGKPLDVTVAVDDDAVAVRVRDHGIGMSPDVVAKAAPAGWAAPGPLSSFRRMHPQWPAPVSRSMRSPPSPRSAPWGPRPPRAGRVRASSWATSPWPGRATTPSPRTSVVSSSSCPVRSRPPARPKRPTRRDDVDEAAEETQPAHRRL